jgi:hypothetical protein
MLAEKMRGRRGREAAREGDAAGAGGRGEGASAQGLQTARCFA